jgi:hypothetical protein
MDVSVPYLEWSQRTNPRWDFFICKAVYWVMTPEECRDRAREAKQLAAETRDLWERYSRSLTSGDYLKHMGWW